jgi:putative Mg2+ transporter-C (MgtC) family protein
MEGMDAHDAVMVGRLALALLVGGLIGLERTYHGRPAGFRTHTLVCLASALLMQFTLYQGELMPDLPPQVLRVDPTRMAQGIMTGIGFLGAGVILRDGLNIRGLTTAASIWITASIGIVLGMGLYLAGTVASVAAIGVLSVFRWVEGRTPTMHYARLTVRFERAEHLAEPELEALAAAHDIDAARPSYHLENEGRTYRYELTVRTRNPANFGRLSETMRTRAQILEFSIEPTGD